MLRKLYKKFKDSFVSSDSEIYGEKQVKEEKQLVEEFKAYKQEKTQVELNLDTGKIVMPDNLTPEEKAELEAAVVELQKTLQNFTQDQFKSLEDYLTSPKTGTGSVVPFITVNKLPDALSQVSEEMENHKEDTEHYSNDDFIDTILSFHNQGYEFDGFEDMYNKVAQKIELTEEDRKKLEQWYMLVSMELVYDV